MDNESLLLHLIKEELRNKRLIFSFEDMGFDCSCYALNISNIILEISGFKDKSDDLFEWYYNLVDQALEETNFWNLEVMISKWAIAINKMLKEKLIENRSK